MFTPHLHCVVLDAQALRIYAHLPYVYKILFIYIEHSLSTFHLLFFFIRTHICCFPKSLSPFGSVALSILHTFFLFDFVAVLGLFSAAVCLVVCASFIFYNKYYRSAIHAGEMATQNVNTYQSNKSNHKSQERDLTKTEKEHLFAQTETLTTDRFTTYIIIMNPIWSQLPDIEKSVLNRSKCRGYV